MSENAPNDPSPAAQEPTEAVNATQGTPTPASAATVSDPPAKGGKPKRPGRWKRRLRFTVVTIVLVLVGFRV